MKSVIFGNMIWSSFIRVYKFNRYIKLLYFFNSVTYNFPSFFNIFVNKSLIPINIGNKIIYGIEISFLKVRFCYFAFVFTFVFKIRKISIKYCSNNNMMAFTTRRFNIYTRYDFRRFSNN